MGCWKRVKRMRGGSGYRKIAAVAKNNEVAASCCFSHKSESIEADWLHRKQRQNRFDGINGSNNNLKYLSSVHGHDVMEIAVFDFQSLKAKRRTFFCVSRLFRSKVSHLQGFLGKTKIMSNRLVKTSGNCCVKVFCRWVLRLRLLLFHM